MIRIVLILFFAWITTVQAEIVNIKERGVADDIIKCEWENQEGVPCVTINKSLPAKNACRSTFFDLEFLKDFL